MTIDEAVEQAAAAMYDHDFPAADGCAPWSEARADTKKMYIDACRPAIRRFLECVEPTASAIAAADSERIPQSPDDARAYVCDYISDADSDGERAWFGLEPLRAWTHGAAYSDFRANILKIAFGAMARKLAEEMG